jgi:hypothetical protein
MNKCGNIQRLIGRYFDGELPSRKSARVERHIQSCATCLGDLERLKEMRGLLRKGFKSSLVDDGVDFGALLERIKDGTGKMTEPGRPAKSLENGLWVKKVLLPMAAVLALVISVTFKIYNPPAPVIKTALSNDCIVDSIDGGDSTVIMFKTHESEMTVIWVATTQDV